MKITHLKIENLCGIEALELDGKDVELIGTNGVGKSSVLTVIELALKNKSDRGVVIKQGAKEGSLLIQFDNDLVINRKYREGQSPYKSIKKDGKEVASPEKFLNELFSTIQLNPIEFCQMDEKEQNRMILDLIEFDWDLAYIQEQFGELPKVNYEQNILKVFHDIQVEGGDYYTRRQDLNREIYHNKQSIDKIVESLPSKYDAVKWSTFNIGSIYEKIEKAKAVNKNIDEAVTTLAEFDENLKAITSEESDKTLDVMEKATSHIQNLERLIVQYQNKIKEAQESIKHTIEKRTITLEGIKNEAIAKREAFEAEIPAIKALSEQAPIDLEPLQAEAKDAQVMRDHLVDYNRMRTLQTQNEVLFKSWEALDAKIQKARDLPAEILQTVDLPLKDLSIVDGVPLVRGLPISSLSEGEKLALCVDVALAKETNLELILIDGVEQFSTSNREALFAQCKSKGVQIIATRTTDDDKLLAIEL